MFYLHFCVHTYIQTHAKIYNLISKCFGVILNVHKNNCWPVVSVDSRQYSMLYSAWFKKKVKLKKVCKSFT